jgi:putative transposase
MMLAFIDAHREDLGIEPICRELAIAPSSYHEHARRLASPQLRPARARRDDELREQIGRVHEARLASPPFGSVSTARGKSGAS